MEGSNFPTDNYMIQGLVGQLGDGYEIRFAEEDELEAAIDDDVAIVSLTQPILSLAVAEVGIDVFLRADMAEIRKKSQALT
jgi:kynureninase